MKLVLLGLIIVAILVVLFPVQILSYFSALGKDKDKTRFKEEKIAITQKRKDNGDIYPMW